IDLVVNCPIDSTKKPLVRVRSEIDDNPSSWSDGTCNLDIEHDFAIGSIGVPSGTILPSIHRYRHDFRLRKSQFLKIEAQIIIRIAATKLDNTYTLARPGATRRKVIELGHLCRRVRLTLRVGPSASEVPLTAKVRFCGWPIIKTEYSLNDAIEHQRYMHWPS